MPEYHDKVRDRLYCQDHRQEAVARTEGSDKEWRGPKSYGSTKYEVCKRWGLGWITRLPWLVAVFVHLV